MAKQHNNEQGRNRKQRFKKQNFVPAIVFCLFYLFHREAITFLTGRLAQIPCYITIASADDHHNDRHDRFTTSNATVT